MREIYYEKYSFSDSLQTEMLCDGQLVDVNSVKDVKIKFPNGEIKLIPFKPIDRFRSDRDCGFRDMDFIFDFEYKGITLRETARGLIGQGCSVFIEV